VFGRDDKMLHDTSQGFFPHVEIDGFFARRLEVLLDEIFCLLVSG
jgi:hypothetical protein